MTGAANACSSVGVTEVFDDESGCRRREGHATGAVCATTYTPTPESAEIRIFAAPRARSAQTIASLRTQNVLFGASADQVARVIDGLDGTCFRAARLNGSEP